MAPTARTEGSAPGTWRHSQPSLPTADTIRTRWSGESDKASIREQHGAQRLESEASDGRTPHPRGRLSYLLATPSVSDLTIAVVVWACGIIAVVEIGYGWGLVRQGFRDLEHVDRNALSDALLRTVEELRRWIDRFR